ncbi:unnamed protein product [Caenorhabditis angaria]|uniref:Thrombospondin type 1 domain protein n=1 Tax=Caenorhabditis angaria TaxID=860376 RepID=A0A9P1J3N0_9PELO|nr:unnamed protein product [Caenorhabditis angaria]
MISITTILLAVFIKDSLGYVIGTGVQANPSGCNVCGNTAGQWALWSEWSACTSAYGTPVETRQRTCPSNNCQGGLPSETKPCVLYDPTPAQPQWGAWGAWSSCSASCGGGTMSRNRVCNNGCSSCQCVGASTESQTCNNQACCSYSNWSAWSACSVTCGSGGSVTRTRQCSCGANACVGARIEQQPCQQLAACPCNTCYQPPTPCNTCQTQPVIVTTPAPPSCSTCGSPQPYYDPYGNGKRK